MCDSGRRGGLWPNPPFLNPSIWPSTVCDVLLCGYGIRAGQEAYGGRGEASGEACGVEASHCS
jgi:hypothetical protein